MSELAIQTISLAKTILIELHNFYETNGYSKGFNKFMVIACSFMFIVMGIYFCMKMINEFGYLVGYKEGKHTITDSKHKKRLLSQNEDNNLTYFDNEVKPSESKTGKRRDHYAAQIKDDKDGKDVTRSWCKLNENNNFHVKDGYSMQVSIPNDGTTFQDILDNIEKTILEPK